MPCIVLFHNSIYILQQFLNDYFYDIFQDGTNQFLIFQTNYAICWLAENWLFIKFINSDM